MLKVVTKMNHASPQQAEHRLALGSAFPEQALKIQVASKESAQHQHLDWHIISALSPEGDKCSMRMKNQEESKTESVQLSLVSSNSRYHQTQLVPQFLYVNFKHP